MVHRPPYGVYDYLTPGRLYTIYRKNFAWQYQPYYDGYEEGFSSTEDLHRVMPQCDRTISMDGFFFHDKESTRSTYGSLREDRLLQGNGQALGNVSSARVA